MSNYADALKRKPPSSQPPRCPEIQSQEGSRNGGANTASPAKVPAAEQSPASRNVVAARRSVRAVSSENVSAIIKRPKDASQVQQPSNKKSKKPKPTLQNMSLGDVMLPRPRVVSTRNKSEAACSTPQTQSKQEFPALAASVSNAKLPARATWGNKAAKPAASISSKNTQIPTPVKVKTSSNKATEPTMVATTFEQPYSKSKKAAVWQSFEAKPRTQGGEEHDLIRLLHEGKFHSQKKGRQRITPRKKKFSTLKKKVLQERLEAWRKLHPEDARADHGSGAAKSTCTLCLENFAEFDELDDDDEYEEIVDNLKDMATKVGTIRDAFVLRQPSGSCPAFVWFQTSLSAAAACACWKGLVLGGQRLVPVLLHPNLEERGESVTNEMWRQAVVSVHSGEKDEAMDICSPNTCVASVVLRNVLTNEDFEDKDSLEESLSDVRLLVQQHGSVSDFQAKQDATGGIIIVTYNGGTDVAMNAVTKLNGFVLGGMTVSASLLDEPGGDTKAFVIQLTNALTEDDFEDQDCLQESLHDIESLAKQFGSVVKIRASREEGGIVLLTYIGDRAVANSVAEKLHGTVLGGKILSAYVLSQSVDEKPSSQDKRYLVLLRNILSEDDLADEECLQESLEDVKELASQYGKVLNVAVDVNDLPCVVKVEYDGGEGVAKSAAQKFSGMVIGGQTVVATTISYGDDEHGKKELVPHAAVEAATEASAPSSTPPGQKPLYSGDKLISERFAECKRVPKLAPSTVPRNYASVSGDEAVKSLLIEMLGELTRLQQRATEDKNAKARRRIVMGLREVARGIRSHKVKMVVMANNLDQYGAIDEKLQEILDLAREEDVPVIFELNKKRLGKAVGKSIKVSVVGIQNADGAHHQFKKLASLAAKNT